MLKAGIVADENRCTLIQGHVSIHEVSGVIEKGIVQDRLNLTFGVVCENERKRNSVNAIHQDQEVFCLETP
jgi:hypothetical protein